MSQDMFFPLVFLIFWPMLLIYFAFSYLESKLGWINIKLILIIIVLILKPLWGFPDNSVVKKSASNAGDRSLIPGSRRYPGEGSGNLLQYPCLGNPMDRGAWWAAVHGSAKSHT